MRKTKGELVGNVDGRNVYLNKDEPARNALVDAFVFSITDGDPLEWCINRGLVKQGLGETETRKRE